MSFLSKPNSGGIGGTAVDPASPGGVIIDPTTELTQPGGPFPYGYAILADGAGNWIIASTLRPYIFGFTVTGGIPGSGIRYMEYQNIATSLVGLVMPFLSNLIGISVAADVAEGVNVYDVQILSNPTAAPVVLATLTLAAGTRTNFRRDLSVAVPAGTELGARLVRTAGAGASTINSVSVSVELEG